ncbi:MAG: hypothetical protein J0L54_11105 [Chitinophagales bacterium]|nr:hypothetical protein [Chitinophagales bacterium]
MIKVTILECETVEELNRCIAELNKAQNGKNHPTEVIFDLSDRNEVGGKEFERLLSEKGYKAGSQKAKARHCDRFSINRVKRGREWRYNLPDIEKVPEKRTFRSRLKSK